MKEDPKSIRKVQSSMSEETLSLFTKVLDIRREIIACPKSDCDAEGSLILSGKNQVGSMAKFVKCCRKTSGWKLANLVGITPKSLSTPKEPPAINPLKAPKATNTALQK